MATRAERRTCGLATDTPDCCGGRNRSGNRCTTMANHVAAGGSGMPVIEDGGENRNATATQLLFQIQPTNGATNAALSPVVTVAAIDTDGKLVTDAMPQVTIALDASTNATNASEMDGSGRLYVGTNYEGVYQSASGGK
jgi:hypothetical protein